MSMRSAPAASKTSSCDGLSPRDRFFDSKRDLNAPQEPIHLHHGSLL